MGTKKYCDRCKIEGVPVISWSYGPYIADKMILGSGYVKHTVEICDDCANDMEELCKLWMDDKRNAYKC